MSMINDKSVKNFFIGVVQAVVDINSLNIKSPSSTKMNGKNVALIYSLDQKSNYSLIPAFFLNTHNKDLPLPQEAVLCVETILGTIIIDRFSVRDEGMNYDPMFELLSIFTDYKIQKSDLQYEIPQEVLDDIIIKSNLPLKYLKNGAKAYLGRNGQYLIFDSVNTLNEDNTLMQDSMIKLGINSDEINNHTQNGLYITKNGSYELISDLVNITDEKIFLEDIKGNIAGISSEFLIFQSSKFIVVYSNEGMFFNSQSTIRFKSPSIQINSSNVEIGSGENKKIGILNSDEVILLLNEIMNIFKDIGSSPTSFTVVAPVPVVVSLSPNIIAKITSLISKLKTNKRIKSKSIFLME